MSRTYPRMRRCVANGCRIAGKMTDYLAKLKTNTTEGTWTSDNL